MIQCRLTHYLLGTTAGTNHVVEVIGLQQTVVGDAQAAVAVMEAGIKNRSVGSTAMNSESSRSHLIVSIRVDAYNVAANVTTTSKLHLVRACAAPSPVSHPSVSLSHWCVRVSVRACVLLACAC